MASYANDLRIKEIVTGDEDGTWGTSTNTNLSLIADAFSYGTKQLAADANETFTMPDAVADGTRALYLKITSAVSLTATRTVTLGPNTVSKVWIIENATTGGQSIAVAQGSGSTVTVNNGDKVMLYSDGAGATAAVVSANQTALAPTSISESYAVITSSSGTVTANLQAATNFSLTLTENVTTFNFSNPASSGKTTSFTLRVVQDSTARTITWPTAVDWALGVAPTLSAGSADVDVFVFMTSDGGTTWYGFTAGQDMF